MKPAYFDQCSCCINIDKNNHPEETELENNPSSNPNTSDHNFGHFTFGYGYDTMIFYFAQ